VSWQIVDHCTPNETDISIFSIAGEILAMYLTVDRDPRYLILLTGWREADEYPDGGALQSLSREDDPPAISFLHLRSRASDILTGSAAQLRRVDLWQYGLVVALLVQDSGPKGKMAINIC
jgi:hypothetical protein